MTSKTANKFAPEVRERAVRMVFDHERNHSSRWATVLSIAEKIARCTVARLMREMGLAGVIRGKPVRTTISDKSARCPHDHVNRQFYAPAPNMLWVSDFTYVATWAGLFTSPS